MPVFDELKIEKHPPLEKTVAEAISSLDVELYNFCLYYIKMIPHDSSQGELIITLTQSTISEEWGNILRSDFIFSDCDLSPLINRMIFWRNKKGGIINLVAVGQNIKSLELI
jgi:hypothetical protein